MERIMNVVGAESYNGSKLKISYGKLSCISCNIVKVSMTDYNNDNDEDDEIVRQVNVIETISNSIWRFLLFIYLFK